MAEEFLSYYPEMDQEVAEETAAILNEPVVSLERLTQGEANHSFIVVTKGGKYLAKVFRQEAWPEGLKLSWIESELAKHNIHHPKMVYYKKQQGRFPRGFSVTEFCEGQNASDAIKQGVLSFEEFHKLLGALLKQVHSIKLPAYGNISSGKGSDPDYIHWRLKEQVLDNINDFKGTDILPSGLYDEMEKFLEQCLRPFMGRFSPCLVHGDPTPINCILTPDKKLVLIDWDNALSGAWISDFAWLTYFGSHFTELGTLDERAKIIRKSFFQGYGEIPFNESELNQLERIMHVLHSASALSYYYFNQKNYPYFEKVKQRLLTQLRG